MGILGQIFGSLFRKSELCLIIVIEVLLGKLGKAAFFHSRIQKLDKVTEEAGMQVSCHLNLSLIVECETIDLCVFLIFQGYVGTCIFMVLCLSENLSK